MSKIEKALRKAEEDKRKKDAEEHTYEERSQDLPVTIPSEIEDSVSGFDSPHSSEHFRKIAARLKTCCEILDVNDTVFTSALSEEGKTTASVNCALSLCLDFNLSVCLVDCDLRRPKVKDYFAVNGRLGVTDFLSGQTDLESIIHTTTTKGLSILPSSRIGRLSLSLLNSERLQRLTRDLRTRFDFVIFDSPPVLPVADAVVLSRNVSSVVLIIEAGKTRKKHVEQVLEQLDHNKIVGFIMNHKKQRIPEAYNYHKYYDYGIDNESPQKS